jgi:glucose-fructose oxidoreductase
MKRNDPVRYAVVGLGHIAQAAVLPAFKNAENCQLTALVSDNAAKSREVAEMYGVEHVVDYERYDALVASGEIDAVYIALPNSMHCEYAERAARAGVHVLCEKPMAVTEDECKRMITAAERNGVKLMIAYRLHFEEGNLQAVEIVKSGRIGQPRVFSSTFTMQVEPGNVRVRPELGGGTLYDIGIYCINAARYLFRDEPIEAVAASFNGGDPRFEGVDEATSAILRFPGDRCASFTASFGVESVSSYRIVGAKGDLRAEPAYDYSVPLKHYLTIDGKTKEQSFSKRDQFAPELIEFASCIREDREPEPNGLEGLADVRIIEAIYRSAMERRPIHIPAIHKTSRPEPDRVMTRPAVKKPRLVGVESPAGD